MFLDHAFYVFVDEETYLRFNENIGNLFEHNMEAQILFKLIKQLFENFMFPMGGGNLKPS